jgi:L-ascorbate metabolism protein UlaG (beta-lactamase superfamily)
MRRDIVSKIKISQIANAGILIEGAGRKIIIDGIHFRKVHDWSTVGEEMMAQMIYGDGKYKDIDYILFTHQHDDHFDKEKTLEYIRNNEVKKLMIPDFSDDELAGKNQLLVLNKEFFDVGTFEDEELTIKYFRTKHLQDRKYGIEHYSFIISISGTNILFTGDGDFCKSELTEPLKGQKIDVIIAPYIILNPTPGRVLVRKLDPSLLILNHLPNSEDDKYGFRKSADSAVQKYFHEMPHTLIFQNTNDNVII